MMKQIRTRKKNFLPWVIIGSVLVAGGIAYAAYAQNWWQPREEVTSNTNQQLPSSEAPGVKNEPNSSGSPSDTAREDEKNIVQVGVTSASVYGDSLEIRAFIDGVVEGNGTCTATLTQGSLSVSASSEGFMDARTSQCTVISISLDKFSRRGDWNLTVRYTSTTSTGSSDESKVSL